jgi:hypothetical protein
MKQLSQQLLQKTGNPVIKKETGTSNVYYLNDIAQGIAKVCRLTAIYTKLTHLRIFRTLSRRVTCNYIQLIMGTK